MQTDRELLELAAKAEGHAVEFDDISGLTWFENKYTGLTWNPLHVDGDAFRLAVKLRFDITFYNGFQEVHVEHASGVGQATCENYGGDVLSATRRAIVRAAAAIGAQL